MAIGSFRSSRCSRWNHVLPCKLLLLLLLILSLESFANAKLLQKRRERIQKSQEEAAAYVELRKQGVDEVGHTPEAAALRNYQLRKKKRKGLLRRKSASLTDVLFPGVSPELYVDNEPVFIITELVQSKKTHVPFEFYDLPGCPQQPMQNFQRIRKRHARKNLGARLQGVDLNPAPFQLKVMQDVPCTPLCDPVTLPAHNVRWLRKLVERQYRIHLNLDQLPVLMRSQELNYAVRGYPVGFKAPPSYTGLEHDEYYLYNHVKFTITVHEVEGGYHITGFDVYPVSIEHDPEGSTCTGNFEDDDKVELTNDPDTYLTLRGGADGMDLTVTYSYEVEWIESDLPWADRWDVYLIGSPDDDIHRRSCVMFWFLF